MLCPSDEDWSSQPTDRLLSRWARRLGRLLMPLGGCRWDSGGPWNPLLLAQLHPFHPYPQPPPPIKEAGPCLPLCFQPMFPFFISLEYTWDPWATLLTRGF